MRIAKIDDRHGGDLAKFLWLQKQLHDTEVVVTITTQPAVATRQYDFQSGKMLASGGNPNIDSPKQPLLVKSDHALNQRRVLWIRDSFGTAVSPYMAATFSETLQSHYQDLSPQQFERLLGEFKPDYVFVTVVERQALLKWFTGFPPS